MAGPTLSLCMIVRDEARWLERCLRSIQGVVDEIVVVDTGSTDQTPAIARAHGARLDHLVWTGDFAQARNRSLELATGDWILCLDADEELHPEDRERIRPLLSGEAEAYLVQVINYLGPAAGHEHELGVSLRLFRNRPAYRFAGALHEQIGECILEATPAAGVPYSGLRVLHYGYLEPEIERKSKAGRNLALAESEAERAPTDAFVRFNLAVEYLRQGRQHEALPHLEQAWQTGVPGALWASKLAKNYLYCLMCLGDWARVLELSCAALARYPTFTDLWFIRGLALDRLGRREEAEAALRRCIAMGPAPCPPYSGVEELLGGARAHYALGRIYEETDRHNEALACYTAACQGHPGWREPLYRLAALAARHESPHQVEARVTALVDCTRPEHLLVLADCFSVARCYELALAFAERASPADAADDGAAYLRGHCLAKLGRLAEAAATLHGIGSESPYYYRAQITRAFCHACLDQPAEAEAAIAAVGGRRTDYAAVAGLFFDTAVEVLEAGLRQFPDSELLRRTRDCIQTWLEHPEGETAGG